MADELFDSLYSCIKHGNYSSIEDYLKNGGDPSLTNRNGWSLLMSAAFKGNSRILRLLLEHQARLEDASGVGETALALAVGGGYVKCAKLLLEWGADVNVLPLGHPLLAYMNLCGGPYPKVQELLTEQNIAPSQPL